MKRYIYIYIYVSLICIILSMFCDLWIIQFLLSEYLITIKLYIKLYWCFKETSISNMYKISSIIYHTTILYTTSIHNGASQLIRCFLYKYRCLYMYMSALYNHIFYLYCTYIEQTYWYTPILINVLYNITTFKDTFQVKTSFP